MKEMGVSDQIFYDMLKVPSQNVNFVDRDYQEMTGLVGSDPALDEWKRAVFVKRHGEARVKAIDRMFDCYNKGVNPKICEERYKIELESVR